MSEYSKDIVSTFSIVGFDPETNELGIAVQSKFLAVGAVVPWAKAGVGAVATQSMANTSYGPRGLELLEKGYSAEEALDQLIKEDENPSMRQVGIVDSNGNSATYTGPDCYSWAGGQSEPHVAAQGNILVNKETVTSMKETFQSQKSLPLAERLLNALEAGNKAGGDSRGMQSAALLIVKEQGGYGGFNDRAVDLRVDDHKSPIQELMRVYQLQQLYFGQTDPNDVVEINPSLQAQLTDKLVENAFLENANRTDDNAFYKALRDYIHSENFEEREQDYGKIDQKIVDYMLK
ncbi:fimbrial assembly protein FimA [Halalkalibacillus sediminis]|uniref:Fimbrial assembly protein FimA n=1 Tax=Halalkalibacillus sediminis TaxID=2018042 RepID=A0A2I0QS70_9BACI|nr:DUF1028 domain-containing protein [Halalkalibacillus sediminis]PKR77181.1 fimbrial assembly protein FimA [Halalkalibacillus sediminis]